MSGTAHSPTIEQLAAIRGVTAKLVRTLREANLVEGLPRPIASEATLQDRGHLAWRVLWEFERAMNPNRLPLGENKVISAGGWPNVSSLCDALRDLHDLRERLLCLWGLEDLVAKEMVTFVKPSEWPPAVPLALWEQALHALALLPAAPAADSGSPPASTPDKAKEKHKMTVEEANKKAMDLAKCMGKTFFLLSQREQAKRIGCHGETWKKTTFFKEAQKKRAQLARHATSDKPPSSPPVVSFTEKLEAVTGQGARDEVPNQLDEQEAVTGQVESDQELNRLFAEQKADDSDPNPLDNRRKMIHSRKRL